METGQGEGKSDGNGGGAGTAVPVRSVIRAALSESDR